MLLTVANITQFYGYGGDTFRNDQHICLSVRLYVCISLQVVAIYTEAWWSIYQRGTGTAASYTNPNFPTHHPIHSPTPTCTPTTHLSANRPDYTDHHFTDPIRKTFGVHI